MQHWQSFNWEALFIYSEAHKLILFFTSPIFWLFFALVLLVYQDLHRRIFARNVFLLLFSLFFYYKASGFYFLLILFSTLVDYFIGQKIYQSQNKKTQQSYIALSLVINLGLLAYFKYTFFFIDILQEYGGIAIEKQNYLAVFSNQWMGTGLDISDIILPVGISFYTFQTISYSLDIYRQKIKPVNNILDFAFYVSFFPQLVAGPIVRASDFVPQIYKKYQLSKEEYGAAIFLILKGLIKKIIISDYISGNFVRRIFDDPNAYSGFENMLAVYGYAMQIYCDFSGYTDIAIGLALLLGFRIGINFNSPYVATSITDFWRRWHISLSSWLRDYLYIPLGGNRKASFFTYLSVPLILIIFVFLQGWTSFNFAFLLIIIVLWLLSLKFPNPPFFTYFGLGAILIFDFFLVLDQAWWLLALMSIVFVCWLAVFLRPDFKRTLSTYLNLLLTMLLGGLWHGAASNYVIWGALHGVALAVHKAWMDITKSKNKEPRGWRRFLGQLLTFHFVCFCWIYFNAEDMELIRNMQLRIWQGLTFVFSGQIFLEFSKTMALAGEMLFAYRTVLILMVMAYIIHWIPRKPKEELSAFFASIPDLGKAFIIVLVIIGLYQAHSAELEPFIYFQF